MICRCVSPSVNNSTVVDASFHVLLKRSSTPVEQPKAKYVVGVLAIAQWLGIRVAGLKRFINRNLQARSSWVALPVQEPC